MRFKIANQIKCNHCDYKDVRPDSLTEFSISPSTKKMTAADAIGESVRPSTIADWTCEKCSKKGCTKQLLLAEFPQVMVFHQTSVNTTVAYTPILVVNKIRYALLSVVCFTGNHWFTWGRNMPPGESWYRFDDTHIQSYAGNYFPLADNMRLLVYYRLNE
jgi:ubiquitin C-terminal hydrolase